MIRGPDRRAAGPPKADQNRRESIFPRPLTWIPQGKGGGRKGKPCPKRQKPPLAGRGTLGLILAGRMPFCPGLGKVCKIPEDYKYHETLSTNEAGENIKRNVAVVLKSFLSMIIGGCARVFRRRAICTTNVQFLKILLSKIKSSTLSYKLIVGFCFFWLRLCRTGKFKVKSKRVLQLQA